MNVFVLNAGSSSFKAAYFEGHGGAPLSPEPDWSAEVRWTKLPARAVLEWATADARGSNAVDVDAHGAAASALLTAAMETFGIAPDFVGHRIVHGLSESRCTMIDARVRVAASTGAE